MAGNSVLAKMSVLITAQTAEFGKALGKTEQQLKGFTKNIEGLATTMGLAFGVREVTQFAFEVSKLAGEADGVSAAFKKLPENQKLMEQLKLATGDTVSELELMKRTVQATNFGISLGALPKLLEFATVRAQQTGQSVDYLVDSIVTGIGRKSPLILDNLGISATALKGKLNGVSLEAAGVGKVAEAVGAIAEEELKKMGGASQNAATDIQKLNASWENFKVSLGRGLNASGALAGSLEFLTDLLRDFSGENKLFNAVESLGTAFNAGDQDATGFLQTVQELEEEFGKGNLAITVKDLENITAGMKHSAVVTQQLKERLGELGIQIVGLNEVPLGPNLVTAWVPNIPPAITTLDSLKEKISELNKQFENTDENDKKKLSNIGQEIIAIQAQIDKLEELRKKREEAGSLSTNFGKQQAANAEAGKPTEFKDLSAGSIGSEDGGDPSTFAFPDITAQTDAYIVNVDRAKLSLQDWGIQMGILGDTQEEQFQRSMDAALSYGDAIGQAIGTSISESENATESLKRLTKTIVQQFLRQALGAIIASASKSGGPPPVAIALAAAGVAAISAMFSKIGASGGGGGAKSLGGSASRSVTNAERYTQAKDGNRVEFNGKVIWNGRELELALENANNRSSRLG
jgi:hypothetical protein